VDARLPLFPLDTVLFPGTVLPLHVFEERYRLLVRDLLAGPEPRRFGVVAIELDTRSARGRRAGTDPGGPPLGDRAGTVASGDHSNRRPPPEPLNAIGDARID
jgi:hypothetical protein